MQQALSILMTQHEPNLYGLMMVLRWLRAAHWTWVLSHDMVESEACAWLILSSIGLVMSAAARSPVCSVRASTSSASRPAAGRLASCLLIQAGTDPLRLEALQAMPV